jgi:hypothetical protein
MAAVLIVKLWRETSCDQTVVTCSYCSKETLFEDLELPEGSRCTFPMLLKLYEVASFFISGTSKFVVAMMD